MKKKSAYLYLFKLLLVITTLTSCGVSKSLHDAPELSTYSNFNPERTQLSDSTFVSGSSFLTKNRYGLWELYIEGDPLELGMRNGILTQELFHRQEALLFSKVDEFVPSNFKKTLLRKFLAWYNRKMYLHIPNEYKAEIYGLSRYASHTYDYVAEPYRRILYLHGAHDIGHALQDLMLVGCSSFATWGGKTVDGNLLVGRNFDFYAGDGFSQEKIVAFVNPDSGYKFMSVTWGGMIGVVSGMNERGLTVTINAGKSEVPLVAKTPISILTREILQYAETLDEAITIAKKRQVFVSESIFVSSAIDDKALLIEISPEKLGVYEVPNSADELVCTNHFQSEAYQNDERNIEHIASSHSKYRFDRLEELLEESEKLNPEKAVAILRNREGLNDKAIGYGNEKALNQLLAHHGIVFQPEDKRVWVSANPYQLGAFVAYDLDDVFAKIYEKNPPKSLSNAALTIPEDPFLHSEAYRKYEEFRSMKKDIEAALENEEEIEPKQLKSFQQSNPEFWEVYYLTGKYYFQKGYFKAAVHAFETAKTKEITTVFDEEHIDEYLRKSKNRIQ